MREKLSISNIAAGIALLFLLLPLIVIVGTSIGTTPYLTFPPKGFTLRWFGNLLTLKQFIDPLITSIEIAFLASTIAVIVGLLSTYTMIKADFPGKNVLDTLILSPLIIPLVITGVSFLMFFVIIGARYPFWNLMIAHSVFTLPFVVRTMSASFEVFDFNQEKAAQSLGATRFDAFLKITIPQVKAGLIASWLFAFGLSFNNLILAIFLCGPGIKTFPLVFYHYVRWSMNPTVGAISALLILFVVAIVYSMKRLVGLRRTLGLR